MLLNRRTMTRCAILAALGIVLLYLASVVPTASLGLCAAAGVTVCAAVIAGGTKGGLLTYAVTAALSLILVPNIALSVTYIALFGAYAVVKSLAERMLGNVKPWIVKLLFFNAVFNVLLATVVQLAFEFQLPGMRYWLFLLAANAVFIIYDIGLSGLITLFVKRLGRFIL